MNRADLDKQIANAETRAAIAWRNGDDEQGDEWRATVERLMDLRDELDAASRYRHMIGADLPISERRARLRRCAPVSFYARPAS